MTPTSRRSLQTVLLCFLQLALFAQKANNAPNSTHLYSLRNGHFPNGKVLHSDNRLILEGIQGRMLIKLKDGYHLQYGAEFENGNRYKSVSAERVIDGKFSNDTTQNGYIVIGGEEAEEYKYVIIKPVLNDDNTIAYTQDGSLIGASITPEENPIVELKPFISRRLPFEKEIISHNIQGLEHLTSTDCPIHIKTNDGHFFCIARYHEEENGKNPLKGFILVISSDNGESIQTIKRLNLSEYGFKTGNYPGLVYDESEKTLYVFSDNQYITSADNGISFSEVRTIPVDYSAFEVDSDCRFSVMSAGSNGIVLTNGIICFPMNALQFKNEAGIEAGINYEKNEVKHAQSFILYSTDKGQTWQQSPATPKDIISWEFAIAEYKPNRIMINARGGTEENWKRTTHGRRIFTSAVKDINSKWTIKDWKLSSNMDGILWDPICNASFIITKVQGKKMGLFSNPYIPRRYMPRTNLTVQVSSNFKKWVPAIEVTGSYDITQGYTSLDYHNDKLTMVYCDNQSKRIMFVDLTSELDNVLEAYKSSKKNKR